MFLRMVEIWSHTLNKLLKIRVGLTQQFVFPSTMVLASKLLEVVSLDDLYSSSLHLQAGELHRVIGSTPLEIRKYLDLSSKHQQQHDLGSTHAEGYQMLERDIDYPY